MWTKHLGTKLIVTAFKSRRGMKNSPSCAHVLHKTLNFVISRCCLADYSKLRNVQKHITYVQGDCFGSLNLLFCGVGVAVAVVVA